MIQKKVCMVGVFGTGKTSLVQQYVHSIFSVKYHSTVGVKIDRKTVAVDGQEVSLVLWDLAGKAADQEISPSYLRGAHGVLYVVDGTRKETLEELPSIQALVRDTAGAIPGLVALNKADLESEWRLTAADEAGLKGQGWEVLRTSAKTGAAVEQAFGWLARETLKPGATA